MEVVCKDEPTHPIIIFGNTPRALGLKVPFPMKVKEVKAVLTRAAASQGNQFLLKLKVCSLKDKLDVGAR